MVMGMKSQPLSNPPSQWPLQELKPILVYSWGIGGSESEIFV